MNEQRVRRLIGLSFILGAMPDQCALFHPDCHL